MRAQRKEKPGPLLRVLLPRLYREMRVTVTDSERSLIVRAVQGGANGR